ncbi:protein-tyrosine phosphatase-like protein [Irpex rosettiformis]|uniref:Protein-tyrosine phosphatase-like protein n=1 Tax=Irpex rosettiformis TaxID=378272 RepID=A0ACB8TZV9_9APHY|nr:protein-tyrosine phosphatase-like protein [Irpex rosettiformis]
MSEVLPNLWIGNIRDALDIEGLKQRNIRSILTAMRGTVKVKETMNQLQIDLIDTDDEDILKHLVTCVTFVQAELDKGRGVLVHCVAGISRSASIVAAYLMYSHNLTLTDALNLIRESRPDIDPNPGFLKQLEIFRKASFSVSQHDKAIRTFYLERLVNDVNSGKVALDENTIIYYPPPAANVSSIPSETSKRRIRCRMCRTELATREHMVDHGQLSPPTPAVSYSPIIPSPSSAKLSKTQLPMSSVDSSSQPTTALELVDAQEAAALGQSISRKISESENTMTSAENNSINPSRLAHASELSAQLSSNPKIAALRSGLSVVPAPSPSLAAVQGSPILSNPKCSGYFVEPLKWMDSILEQGHMSGKITCPNNKCGAKLGNYDWAGVCCSCKEWVVPGFCIHRSKVDEMV